MTVISSEVCPKSRIVPLGTGELPPDMNQWKYMQLVYDSKLTKKMIHALGYLSIRYNFKKRRATKMGQRRAANDLHMERKTFMGAIKELEQYGWVRREKGQYGKPDRFTPLIGFEISELRWMEQVAKETQLERERLQSLEKKTEEW
jgi:hypothetical protein